MIEVVTEIFTTRHKKKQDYMHDTVPFTLRSQRFSNRSNVVLLSTQIQQDQEIWNAKRQATYVKSITDKNCSNYSFRRKI